VKSINCTDFFLKKTKIFKLFFYIKKKIVSATMKHGYTILLFFPYKKQQNATSLKHAVQLKFWWILSLKSNLLFLTKRHLIWLRVNLIHSYVTRRPQGYYTLIFFFFPVPILILVLFLFELCADRNLVTCPAWEVSFLRRK